MQSIIIITEKIIMCIYIQVACCECAAEYTFWGIFLNGR